METASVNVLARFIRLFDGEWPCLDGELIGLVRTLHLSFKCCMAEAQEERERELALVGPKHSLVLAWAELPAH